MAISEEPLPSPPEVLRIHIATRLRHRWQLDSHVTLDVPHASLDQLTYQLAGPVLHWNKFMSYSAFLLALAQLPFIFNFFYSMYRGRKASLNPWNSNTLEWTTPLHPGHGNWPGEIPTVYRWPYDYSKPGASKDFITQNTPLEEGEEEH
jgi:hypothetical protein